MKDQLFSEICLSSSEQHSHKTLCAQSEIVYLAGKSKCYVYSKVVTPQLVINKLGSIY